MKAFFEWLAKLFAQPKAEPPEPVVPTPVKPLRKLAWGLKVSAEFRERAFEIAAALRIYPDDLMACMAFETGETFRPDIRNFAGSGATGLIQFMPTTARGLGTTVEALAAMSAVEQLNWVRMYFKPYQGRMATLSDVYMAILWPKAIGKPGDYVLWSRGTSPTTYRQNSGLDVNQDHDITKDEAAGLVRAKLQRGLRAGNMWEGV